MGRTFAQQLTARGMLEILGLTPGSGILAKEEMAQVAGLLPFL